MKHKVQYGVIPYIKTSKGKKLILITSRTNGYWIFPKGNLIKGKSPQQSAAQEALEEAGVLGKVSKKKEFRFSFENNDTEQQIVLFPMKVEVVLSKWPEAKDRKREQFSYQEALERIKLDGFLHCLRLWKEEYL